MRKWLYSRAASDVIGERARQVEAEGFTAKCDDGYESGELVRAAASYCLDEFDRGTFHHPDLPQVPVFWPWSPDWWKPRDRRSDLVRAAALIIAEIERLDRASPLAFAPAPPAVMPAAELPIACHDSQFMPAMAFYHGEDIDIRALADSMGLKSTFLALESDNSAGDLAERYAEAEIPDGRSDPDAVLAEWRPAAPEGFSLAGKYHGEDGAVALFLRREMVP